MALLFAFLFLFRLIDGRCSLALRFLLEAFALKLGYFAQIWLACIWKLGVECEAAYSSLGSRHANGVILIVVVEALVIIVVNELVPLVIDHVVTLIHEIVCEAGHFGNSWVVGLHIVVVWRFLILCARGGTKANSVDMRRVRGDLVGEILHLFGNGASPSSVIVASWSLVKRIRRFGCHSRADLWKSKRWLVIVFILYHSVQLIFLDGDCKLSLVLLTFSSWVICSQRVPISISLIVA